MGMFSRTPKLTPKPVDPAAIAAGLRTLADDIDAGNTTAIELATDGEMTPEDIAAYPTSPSRLGEPGPGALPGAA